MSPPGVHMFYIVLYWENTKSIFSETTRPGALMLGTLHLLVDVNKNGPAPGSHDLQRLIKGKHEKSYRLNHKVLIFGM